MLFLSFPAAKAKKENVTSSMTFIVQSKNTYLLEERQFPQSSSLSGIHSPPPPPPQPLPKEVRNMASSVSSSEFTEATEMPFRKGD